MAIDYLLAVKCEPQQVLGAEKLVELHRTRVLARSALLHMREDGDQREPREIEIQLTMRNPEGDSARGVTLQDLLNESAPLDTVVDACKTCPAELPREFACHRRIRYPIPERVEEWLMARLPVNLQCAAGALLVRGLGEFSWDGAPTAKLRAAGTTYFESRAPYALPSQERGLWLPCRLGSQRDGDQPLVCAIDVGCARRIQRRAASGMFERGAQVPVIERRIACRQLGLPF